MVLYGLELEGFALDGSFITLPRRDMPTDGFPGLVELRTTGGKLLENAAGELYAAYAAHHPDSLTFSVCQHRFSAQQKADLRKRGGEVKEPVDVLNVYGKTPRDSKGVTLASLQINISNMLQAEHTVNNLVQPARYGLLDVNGIVKRLDTEFEVEIKKAGRQLGMYALKDGIRLEYRSLPNLVFPLNVPRSLHVFCSRVKKAVENKQ